jgi:hypothetical protein
VKLSTDQRRQVDIICAALLADASDRGDIDAPECKELLKSAYALRDLSLPEVLVLRSPSEAMAHLQNHSHEKTLTPRPVPDMRAVLEDGTSLAPVWNVIVAAQPRVWPSLGPEVDLSFHSEVVNALDTIPWGSEEWPPVRRRVEAKVFDLCHLSHTVSDALEDQVTLESEAWLLYTQASASLWGEAVEYCALEAALALGHVSSSPPGFEVARRLLASCGWVYSFEKLCLICQRPLTINQTKKGREVHTYLEWQDGTRRERVFE